MPKLFSSTFFWARSMLEVTMLCWIASPSFKPNRSMSWPHDRHEQAHESSSRLT